MAGALTLLVTEAENDSESHPENSENYLTMVRTKRKRKREHQQQQVEERITQLVAERISQRHLSQKSVMT
ncbi:hypothetical protein OnM2_034015 [Erysiphe neolycopersici]|uniref:Uncharacterized protein n=1 Tax=Erysiphe neolycopersici TaxID=212602 RepID=A0A420HY32_9PEZI|nr:hypothetical protein OnM2_034015 [Erysiphe neolycopersici]